MHNIVWQKYTITSEDREKLHKHKAIVLWFTGFSGSGKSTIANALEKFLHKKKISTYLLDGDNIRHGLCNDLGFTKNERKENLRRVSKVIRMMIDAGLIVLATFISPYRTHRQMVRNEIPEGKFFEIFVDTPITICKERDPKKLYKKARDGKIKNFTGVFQRYEKPKNPEIHLFGTNVTSVSVQYIITVLCKENIIKI